MGADKGGNWTGGDKMGKYHIVACDKGLFVLSEERGGFCCYLRGVRVPC